MKRIAEENKESINEKLESLEVELRRTLSLKDADHTKGLKVLQDISDLKLTPQILLKNKTLIPTLKKVKAYKGSPDIAAKAVKLYNHYKSLFAVTGKPTTPGATKPSVPTTTSTTNLQININISNSNGEKIQDIPVTITKS